MVTLRFSLYVSSEVCEDTPIKNKDGPAVGVFLLSVHTPYLSCG